MSKKQSSNSEWLEQYITSFVAVLEGVDTDGPTLRRIDEVIGACGTLMAHLKGDESAERPVIGGWVVNF